MPVQTPCAPPTFASLCGGVPFRSSRRQIRGCARISAVTTSVSVTGLLVRRSWVTPTAYSAIIAACIAEKTHPHVDVLPVRGKMRTTVMRGTNQKRWVVRSSNAEQGQEISEEKSGHSSQEDKGPPVLTIIAGLSVLLLVLWVLGSLVSWIVGLIFK